VGLAIEEQYPEPGAAELTELAHHFVQAAPAHDAGRALPYARRAANVAFARFAYEQAAAHFDQALQVLGLGAATPEERLELLLQKGEALARADQIAAARTVLDEAVSNARSNGRTDALVRAALAMSKPFEATHLDNEHLRLLREVLCLLPAGDRRRALVNALLAKGLVYSGDHDERAAIARQAVREARELGDPHTLGETLRFCLQAFSEPEHHAERSALTEQLVELARSREDQQLLLHASLTQLRNHLEAGDIATVDSAISLMESLSLQTRQPYFQWVCAAVKAMRAITAGELSAAEGLVVSALSLGRRFHEPTAYSVYCVQMNGIWRLQGQVDKAEALVRHVASRFPGTAGWRAVLACLEVHLGRRELARRELHHLLGADLRNVRRDPFVLSVLAPLADLAALVGDEASARLLYHALLPYARYHAVVTAGVFTHGPLERHLGMLATKMKQFDLAEAHYESAIEQIERMPSPPYSCLASQSYALMLLQRRAAGDRAYATELLNRALSLSEEYDMKGLSTFARSIAGRHDLALRDGSRVEPRSGVLPRHGASSRTLEG
jgi:tetratricopeptide (TPR) repeat protein